MKLWKFPHPAKSAACSQCQSKTDEAQAVAWFLLRPCAGWGGMFPQQQDYFLAKALAGLFSKVKLTLKGSHQAALPHPKIFWHQVPHMCAYKSQFPGSLRCGPAVSSKTMLETRRPNLCAQRAVKCSWVARTSLLETPSLAVIQSMMFFCCHFSYCSLEI